MMQTLERDPLGHKRNDCNAPWNGYYEAISCQEGHLRDSEESVHLNCERFHLFCPPNLHCVCQPCIPDMVLHMYPVQVRCAELVLCDLYKAGQRSICCDSGKTTPA